MDSAKKKKKTTLPVTFPAIVGLVVGVGVTAMVYMGAPASSTAHAVDGNVPAYEAPLVGIAGAVEEGKEAAQADLERIQDGQASCDFSRWIGHPVDEKDIIAQERPFRILAPGAPATMDYLAERINIHTDDNGLVKMVTCG